MIWCQVHEPPHPPLLPAAGPPGRPLPRKAYALEAHKQPLHHLIRKLVHGKYVSAVARHDNLVAGARMLLFPPLIPMTDATESPSRSKILINSNWSCSKLM